jgi:hypothetical protein
MFRTREVRRNSTVQVNSLDPEFITLLLTLFLLISPLYQYYFFNLNFKSIAVHLKTTHHMVSLTFIFSVNVLVFPGFSHEISLHVKRAFDSGSANFFMKRTM